MRIGPYKLKNNLILAPMAGVTDRPFRGICRRLGAGLAVSEMVSSNALLHDCAKTRRRTDHRGEAEPRSVQIAGAEPAAMAEAARRNVADGAQIIDINMGCPAKKVCRLAAGSALLRDEPLVARILEAVVAAVPDTPVTLKIRTGWDPEHRNGVEIARLAEAAGVQALAVHGRTRACLYRGRAEYDTIARIKATVSIPVVANGDIDSPDQARLVLERTGADALMIGRGAQGRPSIFREIEHFLRTGERLPPPTPEAVRDLVLEHLEALYAFYGAYTGVRMARKHIAWYTKGLPEGNAFRRRANRIDRTTDQFAAVRSFFDAQTTAERLAA